MNKDQQRSAFEAWLKTYKSIGVAYYDMAYDAWQAALASPEVQAWKKDAKRYRWLRDTAQLFSHFGGEGNSGWCVMRRDSAITRVFTYNGQELDAAIDAAMEKQK